MLLRWWLLYYTVTDNSIPQYTMNSHSTSKYGFQLWVFNCFGAATEALNFPTRHEFPGQQP